MVFAATGSASFDFYGANRIGDNLFANTVLALDARTGKRIWHFQGVKHDLWDRDFPAAPVLVTVTRDGRPVDAVAQITKTGHVYVFERETGKPLFPDRVSQSARVDARRGARRRDAAVSREPAAVHATDAHRETCSRRARPRRTRRSLKMFHEYKTSGMYEPPNLQGTIIFPGVDGGGEWGGPAFDPATGAAIRKLERDAVAP